MDKIIKEFNINEYTYKLGYTLFNNKVYPNLQIYKNNKLFSGGHRSDVYNIGSFYFYVFSSSSNSYYDSDYIDTIKEMFTWLRQYSNIPQSIEEEYESIFLLYKLNGFKKI